MVLYHPATYFCMQLTSLLRLSGHQQPLRTGLQGSFTPKLLKEEEEDGLEGLVVAAIVADVEADSDRVGLAGAGVGAAHTPT